MGNIMFDCFCMSWFWYAMFLHICSVAGSLLGFATGNSLQHCKLGQRRRIFYTFNIGINSIIFFMNFLYSMIHIMGPIPIPPDGDTHRIGVEQIGAVYWATYVWCLHNIIRTVLPSRSHMQDCLGEQIEIAHVFMWRQQEWMRPGL